ADGSGWRGSVSRPRSRCSPRCASTAAGAGLTARGHPSTPARSRPPPGPPPGPRHPGNPANGYLNLKLKDPAAAPAFVREHQLPPGNGPPPLTAWQDLRDSAAALV